MNLFIPLIFLYGMYTFVYIFFGALFGIRQNLIVVTIVFYFSKSMSYPPRRPWSSRIDQVEITMLSFYLQFHVLN